jgi:hypothetical protein
MRSEYRDGFFQCAGCDVPLVAELLAFLKAPQALTLKPTTPYHQALQRTPRRASNPKQHPKVSPPSTWQQTVTSMRSSVKRKPR